MYLLAICAQAQDSIALIFWAWNPSSPSSWDDHIRSRFAAHHPAQMLPYLLTICCAGLTLGAAGSQPPALGPVPVLAAGCAQPVATRLPAGTRAMQQREDKQMWLELSSAQETGSKTTVPQLELPYKPEVSLGAAWQCYRSAGTSGETLNKHSLATKRSGHIATPKSMSLAQKSSTFFKDHTMKLIFHLHF